MTKLKLGDIAENKPVKMTVELLADIHHDLVAYAAVLSDGGGSASLPPQKLIAPMIARFMATDREFKKARTKVQATPTASG